MLLGRRVLPATIYTLLVANLATMWIVRGVYVTGWDLAGATFAVLALNQGSLADGVRAILAATLQQRRPVFTGGESLIYGLVPGLLNLVTPSLFWGHLLNLALFVAVSIGITRALGIRRPWYWACVVASPALMSYAIIGYPYVPSTTIPYALAIAWVLSDRQPRRRVWWGMVLDVVVFAFVMAVALNGYEAGKTVFVVPAIAALAVRGIPLVRRLGWLGLAAGSAWFMFTQRPATTAVALQTLPRDPALIARGLLRTAQSYANGWDIDYPGVGLAALLALPSIRTQRWFWMALFAAVVGLVSLNVYQLDGAFLTPHRFLLLAFVAALVVSLALSQATRWSPALLGAALLVCGGMAYTTWHTVRFAAQGGPAKGAAGAHGPVYPLPYHRARLDQSVWPDRTRAALAFLEFVKRTREQQLVFYGFSIAGEDSVNPQFFFSRILLALGYPTLRDRVTFVDHFDNMFFTFPIRPISEVPAIAKSLSTPFYVHLHKPEYSAATVRARYFNRSRMTPIDAGLTEFRSFRVDAFAPPGPIPIPSYGRPVDPPRPGREGYCLIVGSGLGPAAELSHAGSTVAGRIKLIKAFHRQRMSRRFVEAAEYRVEPGMFTRLAARFDNPQDQPMLARLRVNAADESVILLNGRPVVEVLSWRAVTEHTAEVLLPPGPTMLSVVHHQYWQPGTVSFSSTDADGNPLPWRCDRIPAGADGPAPPS